MVFIVRYIHWENNSIWSKHHKQVSCQVLGRSQAGAPCRPTFNSCLIGYSLPRQSIWFWWCALFYPLLCEMMNDYTRKMLTTPTHPNPPQQQMLSYKWTKATKAKLAMNCEFPKPGREGGLAASDLGQPRKFTAGETSFDTMHAIGLRWFYNRDNFSCTSLRVFPMVGPLSSGRVDILNIILST